MKKYYVSYMIKSTGVESFKIIKAKNIGLACYELYKKDKELFFLTFLLTPVSLLCMLEKGEEGTYINYSFLIPTNLQEISTKNLTAYYRNLPEENRMWDMKISSEQVAQKGISRIYPFHEEAIQK
jgi:hypothetical protein